MIRLLAGTVAALVVVILFWWWVSPRLSIPAWQVGAIPMAVAGLIVGRLSLSRFRWGTVCLLAVVSVLLGTWWPTHQKLISGAAAPNQTMEQQLMEAITRMQEGQTDLEPALPPKAIPSVPLSLSLRVAGEQAARDPVPMAGHLALAMIIGLQAVRLSRSRFSSDSSAK
ncbi:hypothetical protein K2X85_18690 [bacterium]|nr:hypothetical protein [bacterium]